MVGAGGALSGRVLGSGLGMGGQRWPTHDQPAGFSVSPRAFIHNAAPARKRSPCGAQSPMPVSAAATRASNQRSVTVEVQG